VKAKSGLAIKDRRLNISLVSDWLNDKSGMAVKKQRADILGCIHPWSLTVE
jgi:hypothetical protein